jgi:hypothetical protein
MHALTVSLAVCISLGPGIFTHASPPPESGTVAKDLVAALSARQMDTIATPDPDEPGRFVAALVFPGVQMLVVSARHPMPDLATHQIAKRQFREVYSTLQEGPGVGRWFFHDMECNGLAGTADGADVFYEGTDGRTIFDGKWDTQSLTEAAYTEKHRLAEAQYNRALTLLLAATKRLPSGTRN